MIEIIVAIIGLIVVGLLLFGLLLFVVMTPFKAFGAMSKRHKARRARKGGK